MNAELFDKLRAQLLRRRNGAEAPFVLPLAGAEELLRAVAGGNKLALPETDKFSRMVELLKAGMQEGKVDAEVVAGLLVVTLTRTGYGTADTQACLDFLVVYHQAELALHSVQCVLQKRPVYCQQWRLFNMPDVGALRYLEYRFGGEGWPVSLADREGLPGETGKEISDLVLKAQAEGHLWGVLVVMIDSMAEVLYLGKRDFPGVVTRDYFEKVLEAFAMTEDFTIFTPAVLDLFVIFFDMLLCAYSAVEVNPACFSLPYVGGNIAKRLCLQVRECGPVAHRVTLGNIKRSRHVLIFAHQYYDEDDYETPLQIFSRTAFGKSLGAFYSNDYRVNGPAFANAFNLLDDPEFFSLWLRGLWDNAKVEEESGETAGAPIRRDFIPHEEEGLELFFRRHLVDNPDCAFSLEGIEQIPGSMVFDSPVEGFSIGELATFLRFAGSAGSKKARTSAFAALIFSLREKNYPLPMELITQLFLRAFQSLGKFLHLNRRTPLEYMREQLAQRRGSLLQTARGDLQRADAELREQKVLVAELEAEKQVLVAELARGQKRFASSALRNPGASTRAKN